MPIERGNYVPTPSHQAETATDNTGNRTACFWEISSRFRQAVQDRMKFRPETVHSRGNFRPLLASCRFAVTVFEVSRDV